MECCSEYQTECLKVVTIGYLKDFIGRYIQKSDGDAYVISTTKDDTYCPTYTELTNGSLVPYWSEATNPINDADGVVVNRVASGTGANYASNQLVNQCDLSVRYTRVSGLTISATKTSVDACGETIALTYTIGYTRYTTSMDGCSTDKKTTSTGKTVNNDCTGLNQHSSFSDVTATCTSYKIGANPNEEERCDNFFQGISFRNYETPSNTLVICQGAGSGSYSEPSGIITENATSFTAKASPEGLVYLTCDGTNKEIAVMGTLEYAKSEVYYWKDTCTGNVDYTKSKTITTEGFKKTLPTVKDTISNNWNCCDGDNVVTKKLTISASGFSSAFTFSAICESCEDDPDKCPDPAPCCKIIGPGVVGCETTTPLSYRVGDCGEPEYCKAVIVDGGIHPGTKAEPDYSATGESPSFDSSYVDESSRFVIEVYDGVPADWYPEQGSMTPPPAGITPQVYSSDTSVSDLRFSWAGPSSSEKIIETVENYYGLGKEGFYNNSRCVAAMLQWKYLGSDPATEPPCTSVPGCNYNYYATNCPSPGSYPGDLCCNQDYNHTPAMMKNLTNLGYRLGRNNSGQRRIIYIYWVPTNAVTYKDCPSAINIIRQAG